MTKAYRESGHISSHDTYALTMPPRYSYAFPDMNLQRRAVTTPYVDLLRLPEVHPGLTREPRIKVVGDHICRALVDFVGYDMTKETLEDLSELLPRSLGFIAKSATLIEGKDNLFIGLDCSKQTKANIASERDTALRMLNTGIDEVLDEFSRRKSALIVGKFSYTEREQAIQVADGLQDIVREGPLPIELGPAIVHVSET